VAEHVLGEKVIVGKHKRRTGYRRRNGHRSRLSRIEIQSIGKQATRQTAAKKRSTTPRKSTTTARKGTATARKSMTTSKKAE
jgi:Ribosomal prokaryotic L21 protein